MGKIKIAEVITRMDWGGSPDIVRIICNYLNPNLYDITLVTGPTKYPSSKTREFLDKFKPRIVVIPELKRNINPISDLTAFLRLCRLFRKEKFDIVHTHTAKAGALGRVAAFLSSDSVIIHTLHGHNFYGYFGPVLSKVITIIEKLVSPLTDKIVALTELEKEDLLRFRITKSEKIRVIYLGLELDKYAQINIDKTRMRRAFNIETDEAVIGNIGRFESIKGPYYFVEAAKLVAKEFARTKFILIGEGSLRRRLEEQVRKSGLQNNFIFTGWREDMPEMLSLLDILVSPSLNEAVGMILIEAQILGVPIVATNVGGVPEVVRDGETAILVPPADSFALAQAINNLLVNKQKRSAMSEAARVWIRDKFRAQDMGEEISKLYQGLIKVV